jgi:hypothetical protein
MLAILAVLHLVLLGCSTETITPTESEGQRVTTDPGPTGPPMATATNEPLVTFWVEEDSVNVIQYVIDSVAREVVFSIERIDPARQVSYYSIVIEETQDENGVIANSAGFLDDQGYLLVGLDFAWPSDDPNPNWYSVTERTLDDEMTIKREVENGRVTEIYTLNGETRTYVYAETNPNMAKSSPSAIENDGPNYINDLPLQSEAADELAEWEEFVAPENTLNYNQDGEFFVSVLGNQDFAAWVESEFQDPDMYKPCIDSREKVCAVAAIISLVKCWWSFVANFLCWVSTGTGIACVIGSVGRWIHGWA